VQVSSDTDPHDVTHIVALVQEQLGELAAVQQKRSALTATATAADGAIEVTVDAHRMVTKTVVDDSYLDDFELADLGGHITTAAQAAAREIERQSAALLAPVTERRNEILSHSRPVGDMPSLQELMSILNPERPAADRLRPTDNGDDVWAEGSHYPTVRS
jgi:DNA-binding protein YbaB